MKKSLVWMLVFICLISFVYAACSSDADCSDGEACDAVGECIVYCDIPDTECSDYEDNDGDGLFDFIDSDGDGVVDDSRSDPECRSPYDTDESSDPECADGEDSDGDSSGLISESTYSIDYPYDSDCESPEDESESSGGVPMEAAEMESGFWGWIVDLLTFWN